MAQKFTLDKQQKQTILFVGGIALAYFGIIRPILNRLHFTKSAEQKQLEKRKKQQIEDQIKISSKKKKPLLTIQEAQSVADAIYNDLKNTVVNDDISDAVRQLMSIKTDADAWTVYKYFGKRKEYWFGVPVTDLIDLPAFVKRNIGTGDNFEIIKKLNLLYDRRGMKFRI